MRRITDPAPGGTQPQAGGLISEQIAAIEAELATQTTVIDLAIEHPEGGGWDVEEPRTPPGRSLTCLSYPKGTPRACIPARFWRLIEVHYGTSGDGPLTLVYLAEPGAGELAALMWQLQLSAGRSGGRVIVTEADGAQTEAPPIAAQRGRKGGRR